MLELGNGAVVGVWKMPETESDIVELIAEFAPRLAMVLIEKVGAMPKQGLASTAKFMRGYGFLRGVLATLQIKREEIRPQEWQKGMSCMTKGDKNISKTRAQQLFPKIKVTHALADSLLIAEHCRRSYK